MTRISKYHVREEVLEKLFDLFFEVVGKKSDRIEFKQIIGEIFSPTERVMIAKRIAIMYLIIKDIDYYNICSVLKVSQATVAKFKFLMLKSEAVKSTISKMVRAEKVGTFLDDLFNMFYPPGRPGVNWKLAWQRKNRSEQKKTFGL